MESDLTKIILALDSNVTVPPGINDQAAKVLSIINDSVETFSLGGGDGVTIDDAIDCLINIPIMPSVGVSNKSTSRRTSDMNRLYHTREIGTLVLPSATISLILGNADQLSYYSSAGNMHVKFPINGNILPFYYVHGVAGGSASQKSPFHLVNDGQDEFGYLFCFLDKTDINDVRFFWKMVPMTSSNVLDFDNMYDVPPGQKFEVEVGSGLLYVTFYIFFKFYRVPASGTPTMPYFTSKFISSVEKTLLFPYISDSDNFIPPLTVQSTFINKPSMNLWHAHGKCIIYNFDTSTSFRAHSFTYQSETSKSITDNSAILIL